MVNRKKGQNSVAVWCKETTWHGFPDLYKSRSSFSRLFWLAILVICCFNIVILITSFVQDFAYGEKFTVSEYYEESKGALQFPNITICNFNQLNGTRIKENNVSWQLLKYVLKSDEAFDDSYYFLDMGNLSYFEKFYDEFVKENGQDKLDSLMYSLNMDCPGTVMLCFWKRKLLNNCCQYVRLVKGYLKTCLALNMPQEEDGSPAKQTQPGQTL